MTRLKTVLPAIAAFLLVLSAIVVSQAIGHAAADEGGEGSKIRIGLAIAPVPLDMAGKNPALVGLGSYIVNAQSECAGCHSDPTFAAGGDPHLDQPEQINVDTYLSGGRAFGPFIARNLTPNSSGRPAGYTLEQFLEVINTGVDLKHGAPPVPSAENDILQVMPWPAYSKMTDREKVAIYEYLTAIPCIPGRPGVPQTGSTARCD
jgi:hypothetical protein